MAPETGGIILEFIGEIKEKEKYYGKDYDLSRSSGWSGFSSAKGSYRWIRAYADNISTLDKGAPTYFFQKALSLIDTTYWDDDYPEPVSIKSQVRGMVEKYMTGS